jgi:hypothetical protein
MHLPSLFLKVEVENQVLDSREKLEYCCSKMQDLGKHICYFGISSY